jgi:hypothetical protein
MPVNRDISLNLKTGAILRREGFNGHSRIKPEIERILLEQLALVKTANLLEPAITYEIYPLTSSSHKQLFPRDPTALLQSSLLLLLPDAQELVFVVGTIGPKLEKQVTEYNNKGEALRGLLLDGIGSAAVDSLTQQTCKLITGEASARGYQMSSPISPGMPGLPITAQQQLLTIASAREIGVNLTSSGMMVPRKSASMVVGLGLKMPTWTRAEVCAHCSLNKTCHYKIVKSVKCQHKTPTGR